MKLYFDLEHQQNSERWKREGSQGPGADENKGLLKAQKLNKKKKKSDAYFHDPVEAWLRGSEESLPKQLAVGHPGSQNWVMVMLLPSALSESLPRSSLRFDLSITLSRAPDHPPNEYVPGPGS